MRSKKDRFIAYKSQNDHPLILAGRLCESDLEEIKIYNESPQFVLTESYRLSDKCWSGIYKEELRMMCGVGPLSVTKENTVGVAWLLGTGNYREFMRSFIPLSYSLVEEMHRLYPVLMNFVHSENINSRTWLEHIGFSNINEVPNFMNSGKTFIHYQKIKA